MLQNYQLLNFVYDRPTNTINSQRNQIPLPITNLSRVGAGVSCAYLFAVFVCFRYLRFVLFGLVGIFGLPLSQVVTH